MAPENQAVENDPSNPLLNRSHQALTKDNFFKKYVTTLAKNLNETNPPSVYTSFDGTQKLLEGSDMLEISQQPSLFRMQSKLT